MNFVDYWFEQLDMRASAARAAVNPAISREERERIRGGIAEINAFYGFRPAAIRQRATVTDRDSASAIPVSRAPLFRHLILHTLRQEQTVTDRRNLLDRSETLSRLVRWMGEQRSPVEAVPRDIAEGGAAARILARLAMRGFVRRVDGGWCSTPVLRSAAEMIPET